jgi:hypothetical protein
MIKKVLPLCLFLAACGNSSDSNSGCDRPQNLVLLGKKVQGDFNGDCKIESLEVYMAKEGFGHPQTDSVYEYNLFKFRCSDKGIQLPDDISNYPHPQLVNEGDLNNDGSDELSIIDYSTNGTQVDMKVYSFDGKKWKQILSPTIEPGVGTDITLDELQKRVYLKDGKICYMNSDVNGILTEKHL